LTNLYNFPVFQRKYPDNLPGILLDIFLGKPALIVEHHSYFKNEDSTIGGLIDRINTTCPDIQWESLAEIAMHTYLAKKVDERTFCCRLYSEKAIVQNDDDSEKTFVITKREDCDTKIIGVFVNGERREYFFDNGLLEFSSNIGPRESIKIKIEYQREVAPARTARLWNGPRVLGRRLLAEFRDEYLCRHEGLLNRAFRLKSHVMKKRMVDEKHGSNPR
jgi:hypothetical protein